MHSLLQSERTRSTAEVLNLNELTERCMGNLEFAERVLARFQQLLDVDLQAVTQAASVEDFGQVAQIAHRIKGAAANVAARALVKVAAELEASAKSHDVDTVWSRLPVLKAECDRLQRCIPRFPLPTSQTS